MSWWSGWESYWFGPRAAQGFAVIRALTAALVVAWLLPYAGQAEQYHGLAGWFDATAYAEAAALPDGPPQPIGWSLLFLVGDNAGLCNLLWGAAVAAASLLAWGVLPRWTSILTWLAVASFSANPALLADADHFLALLSFYVMLGSWWHGGGWVGPLLVWPLRPMDAAPSRAANLALRLIQYHFAVTLLFCGLHKLQFGEWWAGVALWYPLHPPFAVELAQIRGWAPQAERYLFGLSLAAYAVLLWQIFFPAFAWRREARPLLLGGAVVGWLGTAFLWQAPWYGPALLIGVLAYLTPDEWSWGLSWLGQAGTTPREGSSP